MDNSKIRRDHTRKNRTYRVRKKTRGTEQKPRLSVFRSNKHIYAQIIDDIQGITLVGVGTQSKDIKSTEFGKKSKVAARHIGKQIGELAGQKNIKSVIFDRGRFQYHGIVAEVAEGAREAGLQF